MTDKAAEFGIVVRTPGGPENLEWAELPAAAPGPNEAIPVLAFSADSDPEGLLGHGGFEDIVGKPLNAAALIDTVSKWTRWSAPPVETEAGFAGR